ncbi:MAG TPA: UDP-2,3-diacylglucosamine diphosphatase [Acidiferrobacteraceae bacterium]|nr:UDP-2,3-diacylglucosamine diphosphatase [Acidiferrobacteraceae bacterium]
MTLLFISDLHLSPQRPEIVGLFLDFLQKRAARSQGLYILGDLFEYWIGDEALQEPALAPIIDGLRTLTDGGIPVAVMHGNRDFLLGSAFCAATGCSLLPETEILTLGGEAVLLMHGDTLCTDDIAYQHFRAQIRHPQWVAQFLALPLAQRIAMAEQYREMSRTATSMKASDIMDVNPEAVQRALEIHACGRLIHGHTHRPGRHAVAHAGGQGERIVLGDWYHHASVLEYRDGHYALEFTAA